MPFFQNLLKILILVLIFVVLNQCLKTTLNFITPDSFKLSHEYRELIVLRSIEFILLLILTRQELMSIFGAKTLLIKELATSFGFTIFLMISFWSANLIMTWMGLEILKKFLIIPKKNNFDYELFFIAVIIGPLVEEYCFRGLIWNSLSKQMNTKMKQILFMIICSIPFVVLHLNFNIKINDQLHLIFMWSTCAISTLILFQWRKSILTGYCLHAFANACIYFGHHIIN